VVAQGEDELAELAKIHCAFRNTRAATEVIDAGFIPRIIQATTHVYQQATVADRQEHKLLNSFARLHILAKNLVQDAAGRKAVLGNLQLWQMLCRVAIEPESVHLLTSFAKVLTHCFVDVHHELAKLRKKDAREAWYKGHRAELVPVADALKRLTWLHNGLYSDEKELLRQVEVLAGTHGA
jgi:hypothetical protein